MSRQRKNFVIDTSVLLYHEDSIHAFHNNNLWIPMIVLEELDTFKTRSSSIGNAARYINRFLDELRLKGDLEKGVELENGQKIFVINTCSEEPLPSMLENKNDNKIIQCGLFLKNSKKNVILISRDISMRVKANSLGLKSENYLKDKARIDRRGAYTGVSVLHFDSMQLDMFFQHGELEYDGDLLPNEFVVLKSHEKQGSGLGIYKDGKIKKLKMSEKEKKSSVMGITPRNKEQVFAMEMLMDKNVHMVTITGMAGSGKTLMACASSLSQLFDGTYEKIVISRPVSSTSADIGFLPGSKEEKMKSWVQPFFDNFKYILKDKDKSYLNMIMTNGQIEVEALTYIRGRSLPNTIFILDESQNINYHEAKAVITRMGENSKLILLGDLEQIDAPHLNSSTSGLASVVELFKDFELSGHITLIKGERSKLAAHAAKIL